MRILFVLAMLILAPGQTAAQARVPDIREHRIRSGVIDEEYVVQVGVPDGYGSSSDAYPVLIVLDGEKSFGLLRDVVDWLTWAREVDPLLVVGVSYGDDSEDWWRKRSRDLTPTLDSVGPYGTWPLSGGAEAFRSFLAEDLFTLIDGEYRTNGRRGIVGLSFGGLFGAWDLFTPDRLFHEFLLVSPALAWDGELVARLESEYAERGRHLPASLYTAVGGDDASNIVEPWVRFDGAIEAHAYGDLRYRSDVFPGETHVSVFPMAVTRGLKFLYPRTRDP